MKESKNSTVYLRDYRAPLYLIEQANLHFTIEESHVLVKSQLKLYKNPDFSNEPNQPLVLDGEELEFVSVALNNRTLEQSEYEIAAQSLTIYEVPGQFELAIETKIKPQENKALSGLYKSSGMFCTQCEAQGFRRITYYLDRPDVMALFTTTIVADKKLYPVLLSNGNLLEQGETDDGKHWVTWHDPFKKPGYLFALVAGDLTTYSEEYVTQSGRKVTLQMIVEHENADKCQYALTCLKQAMRWDELNFDREYDLDIYMIVAVSDFNMGAMENKGLNIFNTKYVLASADIATDTDYELIEAVVGHEYFHNWTGNRITCRDWFQLSLKEGLTVFREQAFTADRQSYAVTRINDVKRLRDYQFPEDAGPIAHPIQPDNYIEINNFYTMTVYEKGAEVIRMLHTLFGKQGFRKGMDLYFERYDGQAVTIHEFVDAMQTANKKDLTQFKHWYHQAGTPEVNFHQQYDSEGKNLTLKITQSCPSTPGQQDKLAFHIPIKIAFFTESGQAMQVELGESMSVANEFLLELTETNQVFVFGQVSEKPVLSVLRDFSAPVKAHYAYSSKQLLMLMAHDSDPFNRWEAKEQFLTQYILALVKEAKQGGALELDTDFIEAYKKILKAEFDDLHFQAKMLQLPDEKYLAGCMDVIDVDALCTAKTAVKTQLAKAVQSELLDLYQRYHNTQPYSLDRKEMGQRAVKNSCLDYLSELTHEKPQYLTLCVEQYQQANNMTDQSAALTCLANLAVPERETCLEDFYQRWQDEALVVDRYFAIQACSRLPNTLQSVKRLLDHPAFTLENPNRARALISGFAVNNPINFHQADGAGYAFLAEQIKKLDKINPQTAAGMAKVFTQWKRYDKSRQQLMRAQLQQLADEKDLSKDVYEIVSKSLQ